MSVKSTPGRACMARRKVSGGIGAAPYCSVWSERRARAFSRSSISTMVGTASACVTS